MSGPFPTKIFFDKVTIVSSAGSDPSHRVMVGQTVKGDAPINTGTDEATTLPQLIATAYLGGVALDPQPAFKWYSSNPGCCAVDQNGNCTRVTNAQASSFDSNGTVSTGQLGGLVQIRAVALRPDGSESGVGGTIDVVVQAQGFNTAPIAYLARNNANLPALWQQSGPAPGYDPPLTANYIPNQMTIPYNLVED